MKTTIAPLVLATTILLIGCGSDDSEPAAVVSTVADHPVQMQFQVDGMSCGVHCPLAVREAIAKLHGIEASDVEVDYETSTATVGLDEGDPDAEAIVASLTGTAFTLKPKN